MPRDKNPVLHVTLMRRALVGTGHLGGGNLSYATRCRDRRRLKGHHIRKGGSRMKDLRLS